MTTKSDTSPGDQLLLGCGLWFLVLGGLVTAATVGVVMAVS